MIWFSLINDHSRHHHISVKTGIRMMRSHGKEVKKYLSRVYCHTRALYASCVSETPHHLQLVMGCPSGLSLSDEVPLQIWHFLCEKHCMSMMLELVPSCWLKAHLCGVWDFGSWWLTFEKPPEPVPFIAICFNSSRSIWKPLEQKIHWERKPQKTSVFWRQPVLNPLTSVTQGINEIPKIILKPQSMCSTRKSFFSSLLFEVEVLLVTKPKEYHVEIVLRTQQSDPVASSKVIQSAAGWLRCPAARSKVPISLCNKLLAHAIKETMLYLYNRMPFGSCVCGHRNPA